MEREEVLGIFRECGALLEGHFLLTSGLHSDHYLQCALVCQYPSLCERLCKELARNLAGVKADAVVGPALGGIVLAYELARVIGARGLFMERDDTGRMTLRRGFHLDPGERIIVAEDVMTTGGSVGEIVAQVEAAGAEVVAVACLVDRGGMKRFSDRRCASLLAVEFPTYEPDACPLCRAGSRPIKPGSRKIPGT